MEETTPVVGHIFNDESGNNQLDCINCGLSKHFCRQYTTICSQILLKNAQVETKEPTKKRKAAMPKTVIKRQKQSEAAKSKSNEETVAMQTDDKEPLVEDGKPTDMIWFKFDKEPPRYQTDYLHNDDVLPGPHVFTVEMTTGFIYFDDRASQHRDRKPAEVSFPCMIAIKNTATNLKSANLIKKYIAEGRTARAFVAYGGYQILRFGRELVDERAATIEKIDALVAKDDGSWIVEDIVPMMTTEAHAQWVKCQQNAMKVFVKSKKFPEFMFDGLPPIE